jgi:hypothetical protein
MQTTAGLGGYLLLGTRGTDSAGVEVSPDGAT